MKKFWKREAEAKAVRLKESKFKVVDIDAADMGITFDDEGKAIRVFKQDGNHLTSSLAGIKKIPFRKNADLDAV